MLCIPAALKGQDPATLKKANAGDAEAQYQIANFYLPNTKSTSEEGMKWLIKSAENGHAGAQWALKNAYWDGWYGTIRNESKYVFWLTKLANNDNLKKYKFDIAVAQYNLGNIYIEGEYGIKKDIDEYIRWMKKSFYNDYSAAALSLGLYYKREGDKEEAIYWLKKFMDLWWAEDKEEDEYAFKELRELGVTYHPADHIGHNHSESIVSSNSSSSKNQSKAKGTYTISSQGRSVTTGNYTGVAGPDLNITIEFYDDYITSGGDKFQYTGEYNGWKRYDGTPWYASSHHHIYYVDANYNVRMQMGFQSAYGNDWFEYNVVKGDVIIPKATPYQAPNINTGGSSGSGSYNGGNNGGSTKTYVADCHLCHGSGKCNTCNGTHRYLNGLTGKYVTCPNCKPDGKCSACGGTGKKH